MPGGSGGGGAGGAPEDGKGGGGGAPVDGIGGGGGGVSSGGPSSSKAPGIGGGGGGDIGPVFGVNGAGLLGLSIFLSSIADNGLGGAIVPNRIEASCFALPPVGLSLPSSSSEDEVESTVGHSSSSGRTREGRLPVGVDVSGGGSAWDFADSCCWLRRWKGFVDSPLVFGEVMEEVLIAGSLD